VSDITNPNGPRLIYNDDCSNKFMANAYPLRAETLREHVATLAANGVDTLCWCLGTGFVADHDSEVYEVSGQGRGPFKSSGQWRMMANLAALIEAGDDPPKVICEASHQHGIQVLLSLRMNDCHQSADPTGPIASREWIAHPEYRLTKVARDYFLSAWNYAIPEVREQRLAIIREVAEKYDADGIELDFMRSPYLFNVDEAEQNQPILTEFVRQVRSMLDDIGAGKGRHLAIGARCLASVQDCNAAGMDVLTWIQEGLVEWLSPGKYDVTWVAPAAEFVQAARPAGVRILPTVGVCPQVGQYTTPEMYYGAAANFYFDGADGIYLFNYPCFGEVYEPEDLEVLQTLGSPEKVKQQDKMFCVYHELPESIAVDDQGQGTQTVDFRIADDIATAHQAGNLKRATLSFKLIDLTELDEAEVQIHDKPVPAERLKRQLWPYGRDPRIHTVPLNSYYQYQIDLDGSLVHPGTNSLTVNVQKNNSDSTAPVAVREIEVLVQYR